MQTAKKPNCYWESMLYRPALPDGWSVEEQLEDSRRSLITFVRWGRIHHKAELSKIYVVFCEFNPNHKNKPKHKYTVRGGRYAKPDEDLHYFNDLKSAEKYIQFLCETTDRWLEDINSPATVSAYEKRIAASIKMSEMPRV